ncbi:MAG: hypothetical protein L6Q38_19430, partial [Nitrospira sp.]|nr:hypothetical protein [Nitrospira sp.]
LLCGAPAYQLRDQFHDLLIAIRSSLLLRRRYLKKIAVNPTDSSNARGRRVTADALVRRRRSRLGLGYRKSMSFDRPTLAPGRRFAPREGSDSYRLI